MANEFLTGNVVLSVYLAIFIVFSVYFCQTGFITLRMRDGVVRRRNICRRALWDVLSPIKGRAPLSSGSWIVGNTSLWSLDADVSPRYRIPWYRIPPVLIPHTAGIDTAYRRYWYHIDLPVLLSIIDYWVSEAVRFVTCHIFGSYGCVVNKTIHLL